MARTLVNSVIIKPATTAQVGDVVQSMLTEVQFQAQRDSTWVLMDGRSVTGSEYEAITGNSNLPDACGLFLRGKNNGRIDGNENPDGDLALGTFTNDKFRSHDHGINSRPGTTLSNGGSNVPFNGPGVNNTTIVANNGGNETAPKNITVNFFIKID